MLDNWTRDQFMREIDRIGLGEFAYKYGRVCITDNVDLEIAYNRFCLAKADVMLDKTKWNEEQYAKSA